MGWIGTTMSFLTPIFNSNTRWLFFLALFAFLFTRKNIFRYFDVKLGLILFIYFGWCLLTTGWATVPLLSFIKSSTFVLITLTLIFAGIEWMKANSWSNSLNYLWMLSLIALISAFLGHRSLSVADYYHGLTIGSNMFGETMFFIFPFFLWKTYKAEKKIKRIGWLILSLSVFYFVFLSMSRSSILAVNIILLVFFLSLKLNKKIMFCIASIFIISGIILINPSVLIQAIEVSKSYILKGSGQDFSRIFRSRDLAWKLSYEGALEGGWTGLGFGMRWDWDEDIDVYNSLLSALKNGREKGNSQLAVVEETGLFGFILYLVFNIYIISKFIKIYIEVKNQEQKVLIGIFASIFVGLIAISVFEGWWDAPCSPETIYFWILVGIIRGVEISLIHKNNKLRLM